MRRLETLEEATNTFLQYSSATMEKEYRLARMRQLMALLGNPQEQLRVIHIAGTSGKTSTAYFIRGMLEAAGQRTGLTVSPHITAINERVQIGGQPLDEERFLDYTNQFFALLAASELRPTYFELLIALAYWIFAREKVSYAVIETGLGGLLDGTNVVSRPDKVCVITDIGLDHTEILGNTIAEIAFQKAGIIHPRNHVCMLRQDPEVMKVVGESIRQQDASLTVAAPTDITMLDLPMFQQRNWTLAAAVFGYVQKRDSLPALDAAQLVSVSRQTPPGRAERYHYRGKTIILDGAHNPQKLRALCQSLAAEGVHSAAVLANFVVAPSDKITASLQLLRPLASRLIIPGFAIGQDLRGRHSVPPQQLADLAMAHHIPLARPQPDLTKAFQNLLDSPEDTLLITGSLYLVSLVRPLVLEAIRN